MPFKSEAQRRKFHDLHKQGKISKEVLDAFENDTPKGKKLPEKVKAAKKAKPLKAPKPLKVKIHK